MVNPRSNKAMAEIENYDANGNKCSTILLRCTSYYTKFIRVYRDPSIGNSSIMDRYNRSVINVRLLNGQRQTQYDN